jgi:DNA polymerase-1
MRLGAPVAKARQLLELHRETFPKYWRWSDAIQDHAMLNGELIATFGWKVQVDQNANPRSLRNFPLQANGAEMLRIACILASEQGIRICAPVHDALLIEADRAEITWAVQQCQDCMCKASMIVLDGFALRTEAKIVSYPQRYTDARGNRMWNEVSNLLSWKPDMS